MVPMVVGVIASLFIAMLCAIVMVVSNSPSDAGVTGTADENLSAPYRVHYQYDWSEEDGTGNYAPITAACDILLKANKVPASRDVISQYVEAGATEALPVSEGLNRVVNPTRIAVPITGANLLFVPAPSIIWLDDGTVHPVVFLYADEATITVADPDSGVSARPFSVTHKQYDAADRQAVYLADRGYTAESDM